MNLPRSGPRPDWCAAVFALVLLASFATHALGVESDDSSPSATPYRPSVSTPAMLSAPGWLEVEGGLLYQHASSKARRTSVPLTVKLAFTPDWGIRVGADAWVHQRDDSGARASGFGDTSVVVKRRFEINPESEFGLEGSATEPTSHHNVGSGSGKADYGALAIYSADFAGTWHTDINIGATRLGQVNPGSQRTQWLGAAALSNSFTHRWGVTGEWSGSYQGGSPNTSQFLMAASYSVSKRLVLDIGAARSLRSGAPVWSAFTGFTWLAARVF